MINEINDRAMRYTLVSDQEVVVESTSASIPPELLRYLKVPPSDFKAVMVERGLTAKEVAEAIGRTLSRVSELTHSKGASRAIFNEFVANLDMFVEARDH